MPLCQTTTHSNLNHTKYIPITCRTCTYHTTTSTMFSSVTSTLYNKAISLPYDKTLTVINFLITGLWKSENIYHFVKKCNTSEYREPSTVNQKIIRSAFSFWSTKTRDIPDATLPDLLHRILRTA